jgi:hypothetical protein
MANAFDSVLETYVESDHPIIFLFDDAHPNVRIPDYVPNGLVAYNDHCVSIGTRYAGDGPTRVRLSRSIADPAEHMVFSGVLRAPSGQLSLSTSNADQLLVADVGADQVSVRVYVDDLSEPARVDIEVTGSADR